MGNFADRKVSHQITCADRIEHHARECLSYIANVGLIGKESEILL